MKTEIKNLLHSQDEQVFQEIGNACFFCFHANKDKALAAGFTLGFPNELTQLNFLSESNVTAIITTGSRSGSPYTLREPETLQEIKTEYLSKCLEGVKCRLSLAFDRFKNLSMEVLSYCTPGMVSVHSSTLFIE